jgi:hypothetical protein
MILVCVFITGRKLLNSSIWTDEEYVKNKKDSTLPCQPKATNMSVFPEKWSTKGRENEGRRNERTERVRSLLRFNMGERSGLSQRWAPKWTPLSAALHCDTHNQIHVLSEAHINTKVCTHTETIISITAFSPMYILMASSSLEEQEEFYSFLREKEDDDK